jgi:hypothetical protein
MHDDCRQHGVEGLASPPPIPSLIRYPSQQGG